MDDIPRARDRSLCATVSASGSSGRKSPTEAAGGTRIRMPSSPSSRCSSWPTAWAVTWAARSPAPAPSTGFGAVAYSGTVTPKAIEKALSRAVKDIESHPEMTDEGTGTTLTGVYLDTAGDTDERG